MRAIRLAPLLLVLMLAGCKVELHRDLGESEANEIVAVLMRAGIPANRATEATGSNTVSVEESRFADAVELLRGYGLPRPHHPSMTDIFKGDGLVASPREEQARYNYALEQGLAGTVSQIDGVLSADVHLVLPETDALRRDPTQASASVFIRQAPTADIGNNVANIKQMVANAVPGLTYDKVAVNVVTAAAAPLQANADAGAFVHVLGIDVQRDSATALELALASGGGLIAVLAAMAGLFAWRGRARARSPGTSLARR